jgi:hypothetical protein
MKSQLGKAPPPRIVKLIQNAKDVTDFELWKGYIDPDADGIAYSHGSQADMQSDIKQHVCVK